ncbi:HutD family protein [Rhodococcoides fascians]|uniref:HutD family protein n=1 Tax=Rhodococcoides fascians TaxID=1828 RepID=UPI00069119C5|nr:HutD family protein [Rhodococcus fascians]
MTSTTRADDRIGKPHSIVRAATLPATPWSNGAGTTTRVWTASMSAWTLSIAALHEGGAPFSFFPDHDRHLMALGEHPVDLEIDGTRTRLHHTDVARFHGNAAARVFPNGAGSRALNLMTRRNVVSGSLDLHRLHGRRVLHPARLTALILLTGSLTLPDGRVTASGDTVVLGDRPITITADRAALGRVRITRATSASTSRQSERKSP